ncbi:alpha/beta hydrolase [bacterium]|nr:alpha/beta hydrolase [bacterium]
MYCTIKDISIYYEVIGAGFPVVMIHGLGPDYRLMQGCMEPIFRERKGWQRIYFDLPGMGKTPAPKWLHNSDQILEIILDFIGKVIPEKHFLLAGESYGGYLANGIIHKLPQLVEGLLLICPVVFANPNKRTLPKHVTVESDPEFVASLSKQDKQDFLPWAVIQTRRVWERYQDEVNVGFKVADQEFMERLFPDGYELSFESELLSQVFDKPALILVGKQDAMVGYEDPSRLLANYSRATFAAVDKAGHNLQIEQPEIFNALVNDWLDRVEEGMR